MQGWGGGWAHVKVLHCHRAPEAAGRQALRLLCLVQFHHLTLQAAPAASECTALMHQHNR